MSARVLVTGAFGFLGTHVCEELKNRGFTDVIKAGNYKEDLSIFNLRIDNKEIYGDLRDSHNVDTIIKETQPNIVLHLAARVGGIGANQENPGKFFYDNIKMGVELIERCRHLPDLQKFVLLSTVCSYPKHCPTPFKEESIWDGYPEETNAPYGIAKKALMEMVQAYRKQYGMKGITLIPVNMYGPGDNFNPESSHVIPALIHKMSKLGEDEDIHIWGTGKATREFFYVKDSARGIVDAMIGYDAPEPVNLGTGHEISIAELTKIIAGIMGKNGKFVYDTSKPDGQPSRRLDISRAISSFDFTAQTDLADGLRETINWYLGLGQKVKEHA